MSIELTEARRQLAANAIRALSIDAVNQANSGHPGAPMGLADIAVVLWGEVMRYDPDDPNWANRDRFILSNGHASMLLYSALHLSGYDISMDEIRNFRQLHSKTPGHPEYGYAPGIETTTGPLGQGFANGVGMALATRMMKARFNSDDFAPIDHVIYGICGDGCLMEGVCAEAASFAGHQKLGELVFVYDDNNITIDGGTDISFTEDVAMRFESYGWHVVRDIDGHDHAALKAALLEGKAETSRPTLIMAKTHIGYGSPNRQDTSKAHGAPLGDEEGGLTKEKLGWTHAPFEVPQDARDVFEAQAAAGKAAHATWNEGVAAWKGKNADIARAWDAHLSGDIPDDIYVDALKAVGDKPAATRALSGKALNAIAARVPQLVGGSADLAGSNKSTLAGTPHVSPEEPGGRNIHFGVREHAMGAIVNGMALYGGFVPYGATFLTFSDYMRPSMRLAALMKIRQISIFTHESIYLGEDGPTHQSVEHAWALRMIPGMHVWRPADPMECAMAWAYAVREGDPAPHSMLFTRQSVTPLDRADGFDPKTVWKGGYVLSGADDADVTLIATGSEVELAVEVAGKLDGVSTRVVSMPCVERFLAQDDAYRASVLGDGKRVAIELGRTGPWDSLTGGGLSFGVDSFGESAPWKVLRDHFGMSAEAIAPKIKAWLGK